MTIQMKATEQYCYVALFIMLYKLALTFDPVTSKIKSYKQYFPEVLFVLIFLPF